jgi:hypothetical protein
VGLYKIVGSGLGIASEQEGFYVVVPGGVDDSFVSENGIGVEAGGNYQERSKTYKGSTHGIIIAMRWPFRRAPHHGRFGHVMRNTWLSPLQEARVESCASRSARALLKTVL